MRGPVAIAAAALLSATPALASPTVELALKPSAADPRVKAFDEPSTILIPASSTAETPLAVFLPGTKGKPLNAIELERVIAGQGYRVIGLEYDDEPAANVVCPRERDPACSADFRQMRIYGDGPSKLASNSVAESIQARLTAVLKYLDRARPNEGWSGYLAGDAPNWSRIVVSGLSQGAGMAAYIAKAHETARVVLFSSPWDFYNPGQQLAPWLSAPSATPADRWYASYHAREATAGLLAQAYRALQIPPDHIHVFTQDLPSNTPASALSANPYHGMSIHDARYRDDWKAMYGHAP